MASFTETLTCRTLLLFCYLIGVSLAQFDPIKDFCRRFGHQSAVVDDKLYVDGGLVNWKPYSETSANVSNQFLLYSDLKHETGGMPNVYANLSKNATIPNVSFGILWEDSINKWLYSYGGESQSTPSNFILYGYDILNNYWTSFGPPSTSSGTITPLSHGAGVSISERGEAFYYGGWFSENSVPGWSGTRRASDRLIKYDMDSHHFSNFSGPDNVRRAEGTMVYLPISDGGMLAYFGGVRDDGNGTVSPQPLDTIFMYDLANTRWYTQKTSGRAPENRRLFCGGAAVAQDQSSYNIYIYGGASFGSNPIGYDDIYVLSIPSFQWIRSLYPSNSNVTGEFPKAMSSCNVINNAQMLVIGGRALNDTTICDADDVLGQHNMVLGKDNPEKAIWARFQPNLTTYTLPTDILTVVGGNPTGGATITAPPRTGFDAPDMSTLMTRKPRIAERTATRDVRPTSDPSPGTPKGLSTGAIAGIAVGASIGGIAALASLCFFCIRRRQKHYKQPRVGGGPGTVAGSNPTSPMVHQHPPGSSAGWADGPGGAAVSSPTFSDAAPTYNTLQHVTELPPSPHGHGYRGVALAPPPPVPVELPGAEAGDNNNAEGKSKFNPGVPLEMPVTPAKSTASTGYGQRRGHARSPSDLGPSYPTGEGDDAISSRGGVSPSLPSPGNGTGDSGRFGGNGGLPPYSASGAYGSAPAGGRFEEDFGHEGGYRR
ncbi:hypothetical protein NCU09171 [Neurospora crassa OR74A]|uniref:Attractin/MKLN-like beta-propeller domain-containing protein n=1 Tax=Neurospora crassa (strain ATCC 24698 / 74-OR23-1A / CBS 708.71 / DSM 1257 / FGSC 987) TaxID=367110 RepID=Q7S344_NEUCR|nr:hypothetical protein NCU09171 [Neurospora crassa OR74A]EAA29845.2 hypothetical protein NCU09171 [Neurospora crassa OR74A]|eukprot:XP_959081.2 hypothetical protein NCU09171 [Neurospora crassa OR74A]